VLHPGAHLGAGPTVGIRRAAATLDRVLDGLERAVPTAAPVASRPRILLELTAGQGTLLGAHFDELAELIGSSRHADRFGVCVDTCHAFAGGHPIHEPAGYDAFWAALERTLGFPRLGALHLNDSLFGCGSRRDRHASIGRGAIGDGLFRRLMRDERLRGVPMVIETPSDDANTGHARDLRRLRRLAAEADAPNGPVAGEAPAVG
jgi:deoxyribonuclease-4